MLLFNTVSDERAGLLYKSMYADERAGLLYKSMYLKDFELRFVVSVNVQPYSGALLFHYENTPM